LDYEPIGISYNLPFIRKITLNKLNMKNWKTTLAGIVFAAYPIIDALMKAYESGYFTELTGGQLWAGIGFIVIGVLAKDYNVSGTKQASNGAVLPNKGL
jgi:hypothetical protein